MCIMTKNRQILYLFNKKMEKTFTKKRQILYLFHKKNGKDIKCSTTKRY